MKVLIQNRETGGYCISPLIWTEDESQAHLFGSSTEALDYCRKYLLSNVQIVLKFDTRGKYDIVFPTVHADPAMA